MKNRTNQFFSRTAHSTIENDFNGIYNRLKMISKGEVKAEIDAYFKSYGCSFLDAMILNSTLDIEGVSDNPNPKMNIAFIEKYCVRLLDQHEFKKNLPKILDSWQGWMIAIGTLGYFLVELIKFIIECYNRPK